MTDKEKNILLQSRGLIFKYGIKSLTMDDISQRLGISKKTLYQFYENKADLITKVVEFTIAENRSIMAGCIDQNDNAIEEFLKLCRCSFQIVKQLNPSIDFELRKYYPESFLLMEQFRNEFIYSLIIDNLKKGIREKLFRENIDINIIARFYTITSLEIFNSEIFPVEQYPSTRLSNELFVYHVRGIASKSGLEFMASVDGVIAD